MLAGLPQYLHIHKIDSLHGTDLNQHFANIADTSMALLLDSAGNHKPANQYSLMMWKPLVSIEAYEHRVVLNNSVSKRIEWLNQSSFSAAQTLFQHVTDHLIISKKYQALADLLPFTCGLAGLLSYDLVRYDTPLPAHKNSFKTSDMLVSLYQYCLIKDNHTGRVYFTHLANQPLVIDEAMVVLDKALKTPPPQKHEDFSLTSDWQSNLTQQDYASAMDKIKGYLEAGDCYQINFSQAFQASYTGSLWQAYKALRSTNQTPFSAYLNTNHGAIFSISPERFLAVKDGKVVTKPIKGTRPRFTSREQDKASAKALLASTKDRAENLMIVDLLRNDISKHCLPNSVEVPELFELESYNAVHHLVSTVTGTLRPGSNALELLHGAFPGGSITGCPKVRAMEIIDELEPHKRHAYCGSMFYLDWQGNMDSSICIRTLVAEDNVLTCCAGGGIVIDSDTDNEYQETLDKVSKILPVLENL